jgi:FimV-like protein
MNRWMRGLLGFSVCLVLGVSQAHAVALGKIEVASHLGETFFAEIPLQLEKNESISSVFVEVAAPTDYRILEVYRDPALNAIRSDVKKDSRGTRVELSSDSVIDAPFFNLILKVRRGHATLFKKYPVFLDLSRAKPVRFKALPTVSTLNPQTDVKQRARPETPVSTVSVAEPAVQDSTKSEFKSFDGWARTGRYGPMVYGDTISTVARRLRVDKRYTLPQVVMALFNKNKKKFSQGNVNLINAGTYLDVPQASEVEEMTPSQARTLLTQQNRSWNALKKQPRYAAVAEAQKNRYKTRVRMGKSASGVASAPVPGLEAKEKLAKEGGETARAEVPSTTTAPETSGISPQQQAKLDTLQQGNAVLQEKLKAAEDTVDALTSKLASADVVAANARIKKLELSLARLQVELDRRQQEVKPGIGTPQWLTYLLSGLVILLLGCVGYLLRRERPHPAVASTATSTAAVDSSLSSLEDEVQEFEEVTPDTATASDSAEKPGQATMQMNTQEFEDAFTDSIPDLTESDTAEMEALQEVVEEEPDPNVDYMAEAGVYLRYGMEDEAIGQIRMAIKQRPNNTDAYVKLVQTLQSKGDQAALDAAIEDGRAALSGEELQAFETAVSTAGAAESEVNLGDTLPPTGIEAIDFSGTGETEQEKSTADQDTLILGQEVDTGEAEPLEDQSERTEENTLTEEVVLPDESTIGREDAGVASSEESAAGDDAGEQKETGEEDILEIGDLEMGDLDWDTQSAAGEKEVEETVVESAYGEATESLDVTEQESDSDEAVEPSVASEPNSVEETGMPEPEEKVPAPDLDLSGIDIPDVSDLAGGAASADVETSDLDKTIAIDWSGETEALEEITGGFSVDTEKSIANESLGEDEAATDEKSDGLQKEAEKKPVEPTFNPQSSGVLDIGLDEVEVNEAEPPSSDDADEFTSTVRMTVDTDKAVEFPDIGLESVELEAPVETDAVSADSPVKSGDTASESHESLENIETETLDPVIEDGDITHELDGLLTELDMDTEVTLDADTSPDSLNIDKARSLLAEGALNEAESSFQAAADAGDTRGDGLLGLAEVAQQRGDAGKVNELLAEAEALVDDSNREWFESIKSKQD